MENNKIIINHINGLSIKIKTSLNLLATRIFLITTAALLFFTPYIFRYFIKTFSLIMFSSQVIIFICMFLFYLFFTITFILNCLWLLFGYEIIEVLSNIIMIKTSIFGITKSVKIEITNKADFNLFIVTKRLSTEGLNFAKRDPICIQNAKKKYYFGNILNIVEASEIINRIKNELQSS